MHILILVSWYKTNENKMAGSFFEEQARMLQKDGHKVAILYPECRLSIKSNFKKSNKQENYDDNGIITQYVVSNSIVPRSRTLNYKLCAYKAYKQFKRYVKENGTPDVIHAQSTFSAGIVAEYIAKKTGIPYVLTEHYTGLIISNHKKQIANRKILQSVFSNASRVVFVSDYFKNVVLEEYAIESSPKYMVVPNIVNPIFYETFSVKQKSEPFTFVAIGHLNENKGFMSLLTSFKLLIDSGEQAILNIVGKGHLEEEMMNYIRANNLDTKVRLLGILNRQEIKNLIDNAHVLVSTTIFETFGVAIIESMACGRPVVATNSGGSSYTVRKEDGFLLKENTVSDIYESMKRIIYNYDLFDQYQIQQAAINRFGEKHVLKIYNDIFNKIIEKR